MHNLYPLDIQGSQRLAVKFVGQWAKALFVWNILPFILQERHTPTESTEGGRIDFPILGVNDGDGNAT